MSAHRSNALCASQTIVLCTPLLQDAQLEDEINYCSVTICMLNLDDLDAGVFFHTRQHLKNPAAISSGVAVDRGAGGEEVHTCSRVPEAATLSQLWPLKCPWGPQVLQEWLLLQPCPSAFVAGLSADRAFDLFFRVLSYRLHAQIAWCLRCL